jgi:hypothetical protein
MTKKLVWIVEDKETGQIRSNWSTGTRVYTRIHNALARLGGWNKGHYKVVEYELVPTGEEYTEDE